MTLQLLRHVREVAAGERHPGVTHSTSRVLCYTLNENNEGKRGSRTDGNTWSDSVASAVPGVRAGRG